ncbi:hypothetical protein PIROE2DRAFT_17069 [Piromyces sp. E2]|nr:hypothetical protein PIROE2DRAFT_17069 [Piromyces sp. E2]|eukprot:OUM57826.1 hypothetical protein PIROE2DRAFT_17069 [Piromyces sp. E2]
MEEKIQRAIIKLKRQRFLNKNRVIDELFKETNNNSGILETSCVLSLKCPISRIRIKTPIRFHQCKHAQCFDADSFFQLTLSSIIKKCPICNLQANYNSLVVDGLFYEILKHTSNHVEQVTLYSNGNWEIKNDNHNNINNNNNNSNSNSNSNSNNNRNRYSCRPKTTTTNNNNKNHNNKNTKYKSSNNEVYHYNISYPPESISKKSNNKNVTYTYKIVGKYLNYSDI